MIVMKHSVLTGKLHSREIPITEKEYVEFLRGTHGVVSRAFPHLSNEEREFVANGITPEEWKELLARNEV